MAEAPYFTLPDVRCACGSAQLVAARPGTDPETHDLIGLLTPGKPTIGWCAACSWDRDAAYADARRDLGEDRGP